MTELEFRNSILKFEEEGSALKGREAQLQSEMQIFNEKWNGFCKENGLPQNFTLPELVAWSIRKARA